MEIGEGAPLPKKELLANTRESCLKVHMCVKPWPHLGWADDQPNPCLPKSLGSLTHTRQLDLRRRRWAEKKKINEKMRKDTPQSHPFHYSLFLTSHRQTAATTTKEKQKINPLASFLLLLPIKCHLPFTFAFSWVDMWASSEWWWNRVLMICDSWAENLRERGRKKDVSQLGGAFSRPFALWLASLSFLSVRRWGTPTLTCRFVP